MIEIRHGLKLDRYKTHFIEIVIDKMEVDAEDRNRLKSSVNLAMQHGKGIIMLLDAIKKVPRFFSRQLMCPTTGLSYNEPAPHTFSFNSPQGACSHCNGLGTVNQIDISKVIPDPEMSIKKGGILPLGPYKNTLIFWQIEAVASKYKFSLSTPIREIPEEGLNVLLYGSEETFKLENTPLGYSTNYFLSFEGIINFIANHLNSTGQKDEEKWTEQYIQKIICPDCNGTRLKKESLYFLLHDKNIAELSAMDISELQTWLLNVDQYLNNKQHAIATEILKELKTRISFLLDVGLDYLALNRSAGSLSGGESQRIRLATQIGSQLVNVLYILDEPSIGLHQRDNHRLIDSLKELRDSGNSVIVVEHDRQMIMSADFVVDLGPYAGRHGGEICASGTPDQIMKGKSLTAQYLNHEKSIHVPEKRREGNGKKLSLFGATGNNLKNVNIEFPLGKFICITGVSGSGKSSVIYDTLYPILSKYFYRSHQAPLPYKEIKGLEHIDKVIEVDQAPLGRTPRSNPATYTGVFTDIRKLFEQTRESKIRAYKAGRFSFNVKGGRCETCQGAGLQTIEMNFLPDVYVHCNECNGKRYNRETLEVRYKGKNISEVLDMTISQAVEFFENIPVIRHKLITIDQVGLGYVTLGQPSTTLSGGESQRIKLAAELSKKDTGKTLYILDEPTTGLHFEDVNVLLDVLNKLVEKGNTVVVIEHNLDVIKVADHIIDMGPEGGVRGGEILCTGTPEEIVKSKKSFTAQYLKEELDLKH
jgi:excinuclease ABC subunit A